MYSVITVFSDSYVDNTHLCEARPVPYMWSPILFYAESESFDEFTVSNAHPDKKNIL
jgi:hypothetical protein